MRLGNKKRFGYFFNNKICLSREIRVLWFLKFYLNKNSNPELLRLQNPIPGAVFFHDSSHRANTERTFKPRTHPFSKIPLRLMPHRVILLLVPMDQNDHRKRIFQTRH